MNSAIYTGLVQHRRFLPKAHQFQYQAFMMYLDLDELPTVFNGSSAWSNDKPNLAYFKRADYFGDANKPLKEEILAKVKQEINKSPAGKVCLLTNLRYFGYCFNPVSFYYCYAADNTTLEAIVTHITNTPWGKDHAYVHDCANENSSLNLGFNFQKSFHVSPFMPMNIEYIWQFSRPGEHLSVYMQNRQENKSSHKKIAGKKVPGEKMFDATLTLQRLELSPKTLNRMLLKYPFMTIKVIAAIYWQALQLWLKRTPFYSYPTNAN
ncbi:MAG TPA: DUF1365 domain-containing protein [Methylotenera sp.]|nr:DUF1365 domain-containing protein [Methylotenera sp.]